MNPPDTSPRGPAPGFPKGLGWAVVVLLTLQLGLGYLQGALLHRQHAELQSLRADLQDLAEALDQSQGNTGGSVGQESSAWKPIRRPGSPAPRLQKTGRAVLDTDEDEKNQEKTQKDLKEVQESNQKAVKDARKAREQLSITENIRKADEKAKIEAAENEWKKWSFAALALVLVAFFVRWWRRRG
jgi:hypothetical protein